MKEARLSRLVRNADRAPEEPEPRGATPTEVADLEARLNLPLPADLSLWLSICRGAPIGPGGVLGHRPDRTWLDLPSILDLFPRWREKPWLPVASDGCGNYYVLTPSGEIGFVDTISDPDSLEQISAPDLLTFMDRLLSREQRSEEEASSTT